MVREALTTERLAQLGSSEAAAVFIARRAEGFTAGERELLESWLAADETHREAFQRADRAWSVFDRTEGDEILQAMRRHALAPRRSWGKWGVAALAASLVIAVGASIFRLPVLQSVHPDTRQTTVSTDAPTQYLSARGEVKEIALPDGSTMTLDADSAALGRFGPHERSIQLVRGRAFFAVAHDPARAFAVTAGNHRTTDVGTQFDVNLAAGTLTITLIEGGVTISAVSGQTAAVTLQSGQQFVDRQGLTTVLATGDRSEHVTSWRSGFLNFDNQPLSEAIAVMNRYAVQGQLLIRDPRVAALRLSGEFRAGDPERFAQSLAELYKLRLVRHMTDIELASPG